MTEFGKDDAEIHHITEKYGDPENCERQIMYICLDNRLVRVWYQGPDEFIDFARQHPQLKFLVTRIGCGIAGFKDEEIAPLFRNALGINNILVPREFVDILNQ